MINNAQLQPPTMLTIDGTTSATPSFGYLTPDALMTYCQSRLQGIDNQVETAFAQQQAANATQQVLANLESDSALAVPSQALNLATTNNNAFPPTYSDPGAVGQLKGAYDDMAQSLKQLDPGDPAYAPLTKAMQQLGSYNTSTNPPTFVANVNLGTTMSTDAWNSLVTNGVSDISKDLSSNSELSMINLQSLMSQRQEAIQVCTNLVQSMGDSTSQVTANVGK